MNDNLRILVAEDDDGVRRAYRDILLPPTSPRRDELALLERELFGATPPAAHGAHPAFQLELAAQGEEAAGLVGAAMAAGRPFAAAFIDMRMPPGWDGLRTIEELWRIDRRIQMVICTAYSDHAWEDIIARLGHSDRLLILKKPFDRVEVLQLACALTAKWNLERRNELREAEIARQRQRLRSIIDNDTALISLKDTEGRYLLVNRTFCDSFGLSEEAIVGRGDDELFPSHAAALRAREALVAGQARLEEDEVDPRRPSGSRYMTIRFVLDEQGAAPGSLCTISYDITRMKDLESQFRQAQKMEALGRLAGGVAHDFNNLLSAIIGFSELMLSRSAQGTDRDHLGQIINAGQQAAVLTRQLLAFCRRQPLAPQVVDVRRMVEDQVGMLRRMVGGGVEIRLSIGTEPLHVLVDGGQLQQVLANLVVNARDAMPGGGTITISTFEDQGWATITVTDTGTGIPPSIIERIWDPFFTTKDPGKGTGLGLSTVQGIVVQSGGTITVDSRPGEGTSFTMRFPLRAQGAPSAIPAGDVPGGSEHILVVEDQEAVRRVVSEVLQGRGYRVTACSTAEAALRRLAGPECADLDLLLTDVVMPDMTGPVLVGQVRGSRPGLKIMYMTGYPDREEPLGAPVIAKPIRREHLLQEVRRVLDG